MPRIRQDTLRVSYPYLPYTGMPQLPGPNDWGHSIAPSNEGSPLKGSERASEPEPDASGGVDLERYLAAIVRHRWVILVVTMLGAAAGVVGSRLIKPPYEAQATVWVETSDQSESTGPIRSGELLQSTAWVELLKSFTVLDSSVVREHLYLEPTKPSDIALFADFHLNERFRPGAYEFSVINDGRGFQLATADGALVQKGALGDSIGTPAGFEWHPPQAALQPGRTIAFTVRNPRDIASQLRDRMQTAIAEEHGNFLRITLDGTNPDRIASTLNAVLDRYVQVAAELKRARLDQLTEILDQQRSFAEQNLKQAEMALEEFRVATITLPSEPSTPVSPGLQSTQDPVFDSFFQMRTEREQLRSDREAIVRVMEQVRDSALTLDALAAIPVVQRSVPLQQALESLTSKRADLRALRERYTDDYPPVRRLQADVDGLADRVIPRLALQLEAQLKNQGDEMQQRIDGASEELRAIPPRMTEEARMERQVSVAENLHNMLKQRYEEARIAAESSIPDVRILDRAVTPHQPTEDRRPLVLAGGVLGGLGLSILAVILLDRLDRRVRYPKQIVRELGLSILSSIPHVKSPQQGAGPEAAQALEAFRELRLNLQSAYGRAGPIMVTVTSPESGDGKSFVAVNLATSLAEQHYRTLLIDGDIRRGSLHKLVHGRRTPGLLDYLAGDVAASEILQRTQYPMVTLVSAGAYRQNGPELLGSSRMTKFLVEMQGQFDAIVLDTSPMGAGIDAYLLGAATRNVVVVLRTGSTDRGFTEAKLALFDRLPVRLLGAVLNDVPSMKIYRYHSYLPKYQIAETVASAAPNGTETALTQ